VANLRARNVTPHVTQKQERNTMNRLPRELPKVRVTFRQTFGLLQHSL
jgi:hypothetical protein